MGRLKGIQMPPVSICSNDGKNFVEGETRTTKIRAEKRMSNTNTQTNELKKIMWECKECHSMIGSHETIAYHLVDRVLYGWCETCFTNRPDVKVQAA